VVFAACSLLGRRDLQSAKTEVSRIASESFVTSGEFCYQQKVFDSWVCYALSA